MCAVGGFWCGGEFYLAGLFGRRTTTQAALDAWLYRAKPFQCTLGKAALLVGGVSGFFALDHAKIDQCILNRSAFVAMKTWQGRKCLKTFCDFATRIPDTILY